MNGNGYCGTPDGMGTFPRNEYAFYLCYNAVITARPAAKRILRQLISTPVHPQQRKVKQHLR